MGDEFLRTLAGPDWVTPWTLVDMLLPFLFGTIGIVAHFANRKYRHKANINSIRDYFTQDFHYTMITAIGYLVGFLFMAKVLHMNILVAFGCGYMADSVLNKFKGAP